MSAASKARFDLPTIEAETRAFWDAAKQGKLLLAHCEACRKLHYYPRAHCIHCWADQVNYIEAAGTGVVYTYSTVYVNDLPPFNERLPYVAAQVDLEEGVRITTNIVDCPNEQLRIGLPVRLRFMAISDDVSIPVFAPMLSQTS